MLQHILLRVVTRCCNHRDQAQYRMYVFFSHLKDGEGAFKPYMDRHKSRKQWTFPMDVILTFNACTMIQEDSCNLVVPIPRCPSKRRKTQTQPSCLKICLLSDKYVYQLMLFSRSGYENR